MQVIPQFLALVAITFMMSNAEASWKDKKEVKAAFKSCFQEQEVKKGERPDREKLDACLVSKGISKEELTKMKEKRRAFKEARKACKEEGGHDRESVRECLKSKGFERPSKKA